MCRKQWFINWRNGSIVTEKSFQLRPITKPPSAELRPDQCDQDSLPPYEILDAILDHYVVHAHSVSEIVDLGFEEAVVKKVIRLIDLSEYKRRQAAPRLESDEQSLWCWEKISRGSKISRSVTPLREIC